MHSGCALRRSEAAAVAMGRGEWRDGRWCSVEGSAVGRRGRRIVLATDRIRPRQALGRGHRCEQVAPSPRMN